MPQFLVLAVAMAIGDAFAAPVTVPQAERAASAFVRRTYAAPGPVKLHAIGQLTHHAGVAVEMDYEATGAARRRRTSRMR